MDFQKDEMIFRVYVLHNQSTKPTVRLIWYVICNNSIRLLFLVDEHDFLE